jgi:integrase
MASIRKRNGKYQVQFKYKGYYRAKTFERMSDARNWIQEEHQRVAGEFNFSKKIRPNNTAMILSRYLQEITPKKRGAESETAVIGKLLKERWIQLSLDNLCMSHLAEYRDRRLSVISPATLKRQLNIVKSACSTAEAEWNWETPLSLLKRLKCPKIESRLIRRINPIQELKLIDAANQTNTPQLSNIIRIAIITGMRRSEILNIELAHLDTYNQLLHVPNTKTGHPRSIPYDDQLAEVLLEFASAIKPSKNAVRLAWERIRKKLGYESMRFHDLRHEAISRWWESGLTLPQIAARSGHRSFSELFRYSHVTNSGAK